MPRRLRLLGLAALVLSGCTSDPLAAFRPGVGEGRRGVAILQTALDEGLALRDSVVSIRSGLGPGEEPPPAAVADLEGALGRVLDQNREAATILISGLASPDVARATQAKLWHALGLARVRVSEYAEADSAYAEALARADDPNQRARYAFDAGTAALLADDAARAVDLLRRSLVLDPDDADARRNYQIARIALDAGQPEPSDFARQVKARADSLVAARQYRTALDVMQDGLVQDSSVAAFADFTNRLGGVAQIEETVPPGDVSTDRPPSTPVDSLP